ncbi:MAG: NTP transferase domain-containing protein, partial [Chloroflexota bacterium]
PGATEVIFVAGADGAPLDLPADLAVPPRIVRDPAPFEGPLAGLVAGAAAATNPVLLVVAGDMPALVPGVLALLTTALADGATAALLEAPDATDVSPLPLAITRDAATTAGAATLSGGERSLRALLRGLDPTVVPAATWLRLDPAGRTLLDVDRPEDLATIVRASVDSPNTRSS